jgi:hypothetical protein
MRYVLIFLSATLTFSAFVFAQEQAPTKVTFYVNAIQ